MAFVKIPEELLDADLSAAQFRALVHLIRNSFDDGYSYLGYTKLAEACRTNKPTMIKIIQQLEQLGYIEKTKRGAFNRSNALRLTLSNGLNRLQMVSGGTSADDPRGYLKITPKGYLKDTPKGYLKDTEGYLKDTEGYLKDTPHKDLKFNYLDLNTQKNARVREKGCLKDTPNEGEESVKIAPADDAAGRSMQIQESAKDVRAEAQIELEDFCLVSAFFEAFQGLKPWVNIARIGGYIGIQPIGRLGEKELEKVASGVSGWFALRGVKLAYVSANKQLQGVILTNKEVA